MQYFTITDRGKIRETNQDACTAKEIKGFTVFVLADGMGGHHGGEVASQKAIETVISQLENELKTKMLPGQIMLLLSEVLDNANKEILELTKDDSSLSGMGTTCDICLISKNTAYIAHIGDSRVYKISKKDNSIQKLTKDHSLVEYMIETGAITREEAANHPQKNIILQALGSFPEINADVFSIKLTSDDVILMCSDGLSNMVEENEIADVVTSGASPEKSAEKLVALANEAGGRDNITVVIATK